MGIDIFEVIDAAAQLNSGMPHWVLHKIAEALNNAGKAIRGARVLIIGIAYKKDVDDLRESPALELLDLLEERGAVLDYHDPLIPSIPPLRRGRYDHQSIPVSAQMIAGFDLVLIATNHSAVDYALIVEHADLIVDTRGQYRGDHGGTIIPA